MAPLIRERAGAILDSLPIGEPFDWVDLVSKELTTMTLATLFDFPFEERRKLTYWSDAMTTAPGHGPVATYAERATALADCRELFRPAVERAGERRAGRRPDLDAGARRGHPRLHRWTNTSPT